MTIVFVNCPDLRKDGQPRRLVPPRLCARPPRSTTPGPRAAGAGPQTPTPNPKPQTPNPGGRSDSASEPPLALPAPGFPRGRLPLGRSLLSRVRPGLLGQRLKPGVAAARGLRGLVGRHREAPGDSGPAYFENVATAPWSCLPRRRRRKKARFQDGDPGTVV